METSRDGIRPADAAPVAEPRCVVCGRELPQTGRGRKRRTCSARCRQAAQRQRDAARLAELKQAAAAAARQEREAERRAALRASAARAIEAGKAAQAQPKVMASPPPAAPVDPIEQVRQAAAGLDRAVRAAVDAGVRIDAIEAAAALATLGSWVRHHATETSRDEPVAEPAALANVDELPVATPPPPAVEAEPEEPDPARAARQALMARGIQPHAQGLSKKRADAVIAAAELVRSPDHAETSTWLVTDGTSVLGTVRPVYRALTRRGWKGYLGGMPVGPYDQRPTRAAAAGDVLDAWRRTVTSRPRTSTSLFSDRA